MKTPDQAIGLTVICGVPRSGTSVLHALACTDVSVNPYIGEASHFRLLVDVFRKSRALYQPHTRYYFASEEAHRDFHRDTVAFALQHYAEVLGNPSRLVLKDPLLTGILSDVAALVPGVRVVVILRHPGDVLASRSMVQDKAGVPRDLARLIREHNDMLSALLDGWDSIGPHIVLYPMLVEDGLEQVREALGLTGIDPDKLWQRDRKRVETDMQEQWKTPLFGTPLQLQTSTRDALEPEERQAIFDACMPLCCDVLEAAGLDHRTDPYWATP